MGILICRCECMNFNCSQIYHNSSIFISPGKDAKHTSWAQQISPYVQKTIVYVDFVDDVHPLAIALREEGLTTCAYHGKRLTSHDKKKALESWSSGQCQVMVCTTAFGMGIDTPDIDLVIQIGCSPSIEQMVQQLGRAGRAVVCAQVWNLFLRSTA